MRQRIAILLWRIIVRIVKSSKIKPVGIPHQRDSESPCEYYAPGNRDVYDFKDCEGDGHYLCKNCFHYLKNYE